MARGAEAKIQCRLIEFLKARGWLVERMVGNAYQVGIPDLYLYHPKWHERWVDVKVKGRYSFTRAQKFKWPLWEQYGVPIWILTDATQEEYDKLFAPPNWRQFWKIQWGEIPNVDQVLDELFGEWEPDLGNDY